MSKPPSRKQPSVADKRYSNATPGTGVAAKKPAKSIKTQTRRRKSRPARKRGVLGWILAPFIFAFRLVWALLWRITAVLALIMLGAVGYTYTKIPPIEELVDGRTRGSVTLLDREGVVFAWRGDQFGGAISADAVAPALKNAVVATEDKRFYKHLGISPRGIASAIRINLREGRGPLSGNGGSTITQQTAKLLCLGVPFDPETWKSEAEYEADCRRTTMPRKIKEMVYAFAMEAKYTKDEILTVYLNRAYLGAGARGFEAASQRYFSKSAAQVNVPEAAMLAGLLKAPSAYAPTNNLQRAQDRASVILNLMSDQGYITAQDAAASKASPATLSEAAEQRAGGYFADWVMDTVPPFLARETTEDVLIQSTFDSRFQTAAEEALAYVFETKVSKTSKAQAAIVVMSSDGAVRAMVGGRESDEIGGFNRATQAERQTGSAFKPFVYATALDGGFQYDSVVVDEPVCLNIPGSGEWCPQNYSRSFQGPMTMTDALRVSVNSVAVKVSEVVGRDQVRALATDFGIYHELSDNPSLALGTSESTLLEMTGAYAGILNGGQAVTPYGLSELRVKGDTAPLMGQEGGLGERVMSKSAAEQLTYMMWRVVTDGTGRRAALPDREAAGKTGTTQASKDAWFIGFTADYVVGVWMGYDDNTPLKDVTGGGLPADIWKETMLRITADLPAKPLPMLRPASPPRVQPIEPARPAPQISDERQTRRGNNTAENILIDVLTNIFGN